MKIKEKLKQVIVSNYMVNPSKIFFDAENEMTHMLKSHLKTNYTSTDEIVAFYDTSGFSSWENGIVFGVEGIYYKLYSNDNHTCRYEDITHMVYHHSSLKIYHRKAVEPLIIYSLCGSPLLHLKETLEEIIKLKKELSICHEELKQVENALYRDLNLWLKEIENLKSNIKQLEMAFQQKDLSKVHIICIEIDELLMMNEKKYYVMMESVPAYLSEARVNGYILKKNIEELWTSINSQLEEYVQKFKCISEQAEKEEERNRNIVSKKCKKDFLNSLKSFDIWEQEYSKSRNMYGIDNVTLSADDYEANQANSTVKLFEEYENNLNNINNDFKEKYNICKEMKRYYENSEFNEIENLGKLYKEKIKREKEKIVSDKIVGSEIELAYNNLLHAQSQLVNYDQMMCQKLNDIEATLDKHVVEIESSTWKEIETSMLQAIGELELEFKRVEVESITMDSTDKSKYFATDYKKLEDASKEIRLEQEKRCQAIKQKMEIFQDKYVERSSSINECEIDPKKPVVYIEYQDGLKPILQYKNKTINDRDMQRMIAKPFAEWFDEDENWKGFPIELVKGRNRKRLEIVFKGTEEYFTLLQQKFSEIDFARETEIDEFAYQLIWLRDRK